MERRKFDRLNKQLTVNYKVLDMPYDYTETTKDISQQGFCIKTRGVIDINSMIEIELEIQGNDEPIMCLGLVMWSRPVSTFEATPDQALAETGIRIVSISPEDQKRLANYTQSNRSAQ